MLLAIVGRIKRHVVLTDEQAVAVALWVLFAWVHDTAAVHSPILLATSAEANSGKTTLINVVRFLVPRSLVCAGISEAALFRVVEKYEPTIIVDEADVLLLENEPLRAVINAAGPAALALCAVSVTTTRPTLSRHFVQRHSA